MLGLLTLAPDPVGIHSIARGLTFIAAYTAKSLKDETPQKNIDPATAEFRNREPLHPHLAWPGGEGGIRTHESLAALRAFEPTRQYNPPTRFPSERTRPLCDLSMRDGLAVSFSSDCWMAERVGFEPTEPRRGSTVFETVPFDRSGTSPFTRKEFGEQGSTFFHENAVPDLDPVVEAGMAGYVQHRPTSASLLVSSSENNAQ